MISDYSIYIAVLVVAVLVCLAIIYAVEHATKWCNRINSIYFCREYISCCESRRGYENACSDFNRVMADIDRFQLTFEELGGWSKKEIALQALKSFRRYVASQRIYHRSLPIDPKDPQWVKAFDESARRIRDLRLIHRSFCITVRQVIAGGFFYW